MCRHPVVIKVWLYGGDCYVNKLAIIRYLDYD